MEYNREFVAELYFEDGSVERFSFPSFMSVDHVKNDIFRRSSKLQSLPEEMRKKLQLGTLSGDVMEVEFVRFVTQPSVAEELQRTGSVKVALHTQKDWAKHRRQSRRKGTVIGGAEKTRGLSFHQDKTHPIMLTGRAGDSIIFFCKEGCTVTELHSGLLSQLKSLISDLEQAGKPTAEVADPPLFYLPAGVTDTIKSDDIFQSIPYIDVSRKCGNIPELFLSKPVVAVLPTETKKETEEKEKDAPVPISMSGWAKVAPRIERRSQAIMRETMASLSISNIAQKKVDFRFTLPNGQTVMLKEIPITDSWGSVKAKLWEQISTTDFASSAISNTNNTATNTSSSSGGSVIISTSGGTATTAEQGNAEQSSASNASMSRFFFKVSHTHVYITGDTLPLHEFPVMKFCVKKGLIVGLTLVDKEENNKDKLMNLQIGNILGRPLCWTHTETDETSYFRHKISKALANGKDKFVPAIAAKVTLAPLPDGINFDDLLILFHLPTGDGTRTLNCKGEWNVREVLEILCKKSSNRHDISNDPSSYFLKISGREEYIVHDVKLNQIEYVRECVKKRNKISLSMVPVSSVSLEDVPAEKLSQGMLGLASLFEESKPSDSSASKEEQVLEHMLEKVLRVQGTASLFELKKVFEFKVVGLAGVKLIEEDPSTQTFVQATLSHGGQVLSEATYTQTVNAQGEPHWNEWLRFDILMCQLPKATRLCLTVFLRDGKSKRPLGWVNCQLFDYRGYMLTGVVALRMWPNAEANPIGTCVENLADKTAPRLMLLFHEYPQPVVFPDSTPVLDIPLPDPPSPAERKKLKKIVAKDPLYQLTAGDKKLLWKYRGWLRSVSVSSLVKLLQAVPWTNPTAVREVHGLIALWGPISPIDALELLDAKFADAKVREYAVNCLRPLSDAELASYLLQLVQVLKYEPYHYSELASFLMERALNNRITIGHYFFWHLQAEMHVAEIAERYGLLLEAYLRGCGDQRDDLIRQSAVIKKLKAAALKVKEIPLAKRKEHLQMLLSQTEFPDKFTIPLFPTVSASGVIIEKCKCMDSAKVPLWIVFKNADPRGSPIYVIFKSGDDLRQDLLTLQMLGIMDKLWKETGLDLHLTPYGCIATGEAMGMIEVVLESETTAAIQKAAGGVTAALKQTPLAEWLQSHNQTEEMYRSAVNNFIHSVSGYCVATYVLGIGDRHNDNIMVRKDGHLFHIDFGHFLGNFKKFLLYRREKAPFVLTPEFAFVMGGKEDAKFQQFIDLCCLGYNTIRRQSNVFINLFAMMLSTGIPELTCEQDIDYLRDAFSLTLDDDDAAEAFTQLIFESLNTKTTQINFFIHNLFHRN